MGTFEVNDKVLDVRPDRIDFRDRMYMPSLRRLPSQYPPQEHIQKYFPTYAKTFILDQGQEGACTGFGLAAVVNYLHWRNHLEGLSLPSPERVSPRMLYELARLYDEWDGEDYEGSSCRGAMKGWHKHGVCSDKLWPYKTSFVPPKDGWQRDAVSRPLGAYYRVDAKSIADLQSAIYESGAIYASAKVHNGWFMKQAETIEAATIQRRVGDFVGGHAFALVGYDNVGFIIQNSWGSDWGFHGFGRLTYTDWVDGGFDAWVAATGVPIASVEDTVAFGIKSLQERVTAAAPEPVTAKARVVWSREKAYENAIVLANNGKVQRRLPACEDGAANLQKVLLKNVEAAHAKGCRRVVIYLHGGLNNEHSGIERARILGPVFAANDIHPVFVVWKTGLLETLGNIVADFLPTDEPQVAFDLGGALKKIAHQVAEAKDRSLEVICRTGGGKAIWMEMQENARLASLVGGGMHEAAKLLVKLAALDGLEIHMVGHSAGSIIGGYLADELGRSKKTLAIKSTTMFAPAATMDLSVSLFGRAFEKGVLPADSMLVHLLSDAREQDDTVGPYGKSLLYLVSRAFEREHKTPLMGLQRAWPNWWGQAKENDTFNNIFDPQKKTSPMAQWRDIVEKWKVGLRSHDAKEVKVAPGVSIDTAHGSFDNDVDVINSTLERILGEKPKEPAVDLRGY